MERAVNTAAPLPYQYNNANLPRDSNSGAFDYNRRLKELQLVNLKNFEPNMYKFSLNEDIWGDTFEFFKKSGLTSKVASKSQLTNFIYEGKYSEDEQREIVKRVKSRVEKGLQKLDKVSEKAANQKVTAKWRQMGQKMKDNITKDETELAEKWAKLGQGLTGKELAANAKKTNGKHNKAAETIQKTLRGRAVRKINYNIMNSTGQTGNTSEEEENTSEKEKEATNTGKKKHKKSTKST